MSGKNIFGLDTDAYLADTTHLASATEHGAYLLILIALRRSTDGWIPGDDKFLARATHLTLGRWRKIAPIIRALLIEESGRVSQKRVQRDRTSESQHRQSPLSNREAKPLKNNKAPSEPERGAESASSSSSSSSSFSLTSEIPSVEEKESKKAKGRILPTDWRPGDEERLYGRTVLGLTDAEINAAAEKMRRWAIANRHRAVARKSDWPLTFRNWLDRATSEKLPAPNGSRSRGRGAVDSTKRYMEHEMETRYGTDAGFADEQRTIPAESKG